VDAGFLTIAGYGNGRVHRKLARLAFEEVGDNFLPFTWGQHSFVYHMALRYEIPLVFFGELAEAEYGGDPKFNDRPNVPFDQWARTYWKGTTVDDLMRYGLEYKDYISESDFTEADLIFYRPPELGSINDDQLAVHWMSYYKYWIPQENYYYATEHTGFKANPERSEGTYSKYASLDDKLDGLHYYLMLIKFGFGRATSDAAHEIRDGHLAREEAVSLVEQYDQEKPTKYLAEVLEYLDMTEQEYYSVIDSFRRPEIWKRLDNGQWQLRHTVGGAGSDD